jgi:hypothetical protein
MVWRSMAAKASSRESGPSAIIAAPPRKAVPGRSRRTRDAAGRDADVGRNKNDESGDAGGAHSPGAPATACPGWRTSASPLRVSGMNRTNSADAIDAPPARNRNEAE